MERPISIYIILNQFIASYDPDTIITADMAIRRQLEDRRLSFKKVGKPGQAIAR